MFNKFKIPYRNFLPIIIVSIIFYKIINNIEVVTHGFGVLLSYISAVFWGLAIAYLLNPLMMFIEKKFKTKRAISVLIVYIIVSGAIILLITIISPKIANSVRDLTDSMPTYATQLEHWFNDILAKSKTPNTEGITQYLQNSLNSFVQSSTNFIKNNLNTGLNAAFSKAIDFTSSFIKLIFGFIIAVYLLKDKEKFVISFKKLIYALLKQDTADNFINFGREVNVIFSKYVIGKSIDSLIIGLLCFVILSIFRVPFASLISVIIGVTNMIPYFGPIIGAVPSVLIILFASPLKALTVLIIIIVLQQFDGWFLGPKILGSQVGLSPFWIILAILIGGGIFGVVGMFLGVPIMAVLKSFGERFINRRIANKNIDI